MSFYERQQLIRASCLSGTMWARDETRVPTAAAALHGSGCVEVFGRQPVEPAERLVVAGVQKPAQHQTLARFDPAALLTYIEVRHAGKPAFQLVASETIAQRLISHELFEFAGKSG